MSRNLIPGTLVGCRYRWPYDAAHPDCWWPPYAGVVLAQDDPRAWAGTIAFPSQTPDPSAVRAHVAWCHAQGLLKGDSTPVLYTWADGKTAVQWDTTDSLAPHVEMVREWRAARAAEYARIRGLRLCQESAAAS